MIIKNMNLDDFQRHIEYELYKTRIEPDKETPIVIGFNRGLETMMNIALTLLLKEFCNQNEEKAVEA